jgi:hypothetical protein
MTVDPLTVVAGLGLLFVLLVATAENPVKEAIELIGVVVCGGLFLVLLDLFMSKPVVALVAAGVIIFVGDAIISSLEEVVGDNGGLQDANEQNEHDQRRAVPPALPNPHEADRDWRQIGEAVAEEADDELAFAREIADQLEEVYDYRPNLRELFNFLVQFDEVPRQEQLEQAPDQADGQEPEPRLDALPEPEPNQLWPPQEAFDDD